MNRHTKAAVLAAALLAAAGPSWARAQAETHDWTGPYAGAGIAAGMSSGHVNDLDCWTCTASSFNERLVQAGVNAGYDKQFGSAVIGLGVEADLGSQHHTGELARDDANQAQRALSKVSWTGAVLARAGLAVGNSLLYAVAGPGVARVEGNAEDSRPGVSHYHAAFNAWQPAFKAGVGMEFMVSDHVSVRAQYSVLTVADRVAYGNNANPAPGNQGRTSWANTQSTGSIGAAWRF